LARRKARDVLVVMGGRSGEHDVSLRSGASVLAGIDRERFTPCPVVVSRDNTRWTFAHPFDGDGAEGLTLDQAVRRIRKLAPAAAFLAMHGPYGEDGRVQSLFDLLDIPYVGSDHVASAVAMDKAHAKAVYRAVGIPTPRSLLLDVPRDPARAAAEAGELARRVAAAFPSPWVLKTPRLGSSVGIEIVDARAGLEGAVARVGALDGRLLVEEFVPGREFTAPVLDLLADGGARALPVIEIVVLKGAFFDYKVKYDGKLNREVCPAEITDELAARIQKVGVEAHRALGCRGISRTDVRVTPGGALYVLETNTLPGLTDQSLFPKAARVAGISYGELVTRLLDDAVARGPA